MTRKVEVWKQDLTVDAIQSFEWPRGARVVHVETQNGKPRLWFEFNPDDRERLVRRQFALVPTGGEVPIGDGAHVGTTLVMGGEIVLHVYEVHV